MEVRELRIGNLVHTTAKCIFVVDCITLDEINIFFESESRHGEGINIENIHGIPLTEEWLLKFGFKGLWLELNNEATLYYCDIEKTIGIRVSDGGGAQGIDMPHIKCVHQLQNLYFALTGTELTLKTT